MKYLIYLFTHNRAGYDRTDYLCFICATKEAISCRDHETIHPTLAEAGRGRESCSICDRKLNWIDS